MVFSMVIRFLRAQAWPLTLLAISATLCAVVTYLLVWPAYKNPIARMYTSKLGYSTVLRKTGGSFPVKTALVTKREITGKFIGEGLTQSEPVQVPMIAMSRILKVNAIEGQRIRKGEIVVELDTSRIELKIAAARAALETAKAELDRVRIGTVNVLQEERPDILNIRAKSAAEEARVAKELAEMNKRLADKQVISFTEYAESELKAIRSKLFQQEQEALTAAALAGRDNSIKIAESAIREAELTLKNREIEIRDYQSPAPADGVVERVLVHSGEYNQDPGRPAVLLACGLWFECYLDQTALGRVNVGDRVEVRLSAHQDRIFVGTIERIKPLVNFALGGPETNRPIRPLGTGAPEWPATFAVRVVLEEADEIVVPGMTGYASVIQQRYVLSVPRGTVSAVSGSRGIVFVLGSDGESFEPRNVVTGIQDAQFVEITDGLNEGEIVIIDGYQVLEPYDRVAVETGPSHSEENPTFPKAKVSLTSRTVDDEE